MDNIKEPNNFGEFDGAGLVNTDEDYDGFFGEGSDDDGEEYFMDEAGLDDDDDDMDSEGDLDIDASDDDDFFQDFDGGDILDDSNPEGLEGEGTDSKESSGDSSGITDDIKVSDIDDIDGIDLSDISDTENMTEDEIDSTIMQLQKEMGESFGDVDDLLKNIEGSDTEDGGSILAESNDTSEIESDFKSDMESESEDSSGADYNGTVVDSESLLTDEHDNHGELEFFDDGYAIVDKNAEFISDSGEIVLMDNTDGEDNFRIEYIDIQNIAVVKRIRHNGMVDDLVKSIKSTGLLNPVIVAPTNAAGVYVLVDGYRRLIACAKAGKRRIPCVINSKVNVPEIPIVEAMYNHSKKYTIKEMIDYIDYLEKQKGILSATMIEYLLQMNSGDYTKLKDILNDNDDDIVSKLMEGVYTIEMAFKKLEQRRKKESADEKELRKASKVYEEDEDSGAKSIENSGEAVDEDTALTDEEIQSLAINTDDFNNIDNASLDDMVAEGKKMEGFEPHKQDYKDREIIDPAIRKSVMARDNNTCQCCERGGEDYVDILDLHHIVEVYLGGEDSVENSITLCLNCHKQVHLYAFNKLHIPKSKSEAELEQEVQIQILKKNTKNKEDGKEPLTADEEQEIREQYLAIYKEEQNKYKRIVYLGNIIRKGLQMKGIKLDKAKKEHPIDKIGRQKPGQKNYIA